MSDVDIAAIGLTDDDLDRVLARYVKSHALAEKRLGMVMDANAALRASCDAHEAELRELHAALESRSPLDRAAPFEPPASDGGL